MSAPPIPVASPTTITSTSVRSTSTSAAGVSAVSTKIGRRHLERAAVVYVRQSTLAQVREHAESTARQYALAEQAVALGWDPRDVAVIDADLGVSGRSTEGRDGFRALVSRVCLGEVGAIFRVGDFPAGPLLGGPVAAAGAGPADRHPAHRRRRRLRPDRLQRPAAAGVEGHDERGGAAPAGRQVAGRETGRGRPRRAAHPATGRLRLRRQRPPGRSGHRPGRGSRGRGHRRVHRLRRDRLGLPGGGRVRRAPVPAARLRRGVGRAAALGAAHPRPRLGDLEQSLLRGRLRLTFRTSRVEYAPPPSVPVGHAWL